MKVSKEDYLRLLLSELASFLRKYVSMREGQSTLIATWIAHTHAIAAASVTGYLHISSAQPRSGKTLLLEIIGLLAHNPRSTSNASTAAIARIAGEGETTLLVDESDAFLSGDGDSERAEALRGILNAGYRRGGTYMRVERIKGVGLVPVDIPVFCPKAIAGLGLLPDTVADRSFPIKLLRATSAEPRERFRRVDAEQGAGKLKLRLSSLMAPLVKSLSKARPVLLDELNDRQNDVAEPLLAIGEAAGEAWDAALRVALLEILRSEGSGVEDQSLPVQLLAGIREAFEEEPGRDSLSSQDIIRHLTGSDDSAFREWKRGQPITVAQIAGTLKPFGVRPVRVQGEGFARARGYFRADLEDSFTRYLPGSNGAPMAAAELLAETKQGREPGDE